MGWLIQGPNSVQYGLLLFLVASGLTLIFGIMGVINLWACNSPGVVS